MAAKKTGTRSKSIARAYALKTGTPLHAPGKKKRLVRGTPKTTSGANDPFNRAVKRGVRKVGETVAAFHARMKRTPPPTRKQFQDRQNQENVLLDEGGTIRRKKVK